MLEFGALLTLLATFFCNSFCFSCGLCLEQVCCWNLELEYISLRNSVKFIKSGWVGNFDQASLKVELHQISENKLMVVPKLGTLRKGEIIGVWIEKWRRSSGLEDDLFQQNAKTKCLVGNGRVSDLSTAIPRHSVKKWQKCSNQKPSYDMNLQL